MKNKTTGIFSWTFVGVILLFIYAPIVNMVIFSFNQKIGKNDSAITFNNFTWDNYINLFTNEDFLEKVSNTVLVAVCATAISLIIGTFAAIAISRQKKWLKDFTLAINNIPIVTPEIITALSLLLLILSAGIGFSARGFGTMLLAHIAFCTPYVIITVYPKIKNLDPNLLDAAYDLGATPVTGLFKVILPQLKVAIFAAAAIAFTMSFDDFVISYFVGGNFQNIASYLYTSQTTELIVNALTSIIMVFIGSKVIFDYIKTKRINSKEEEEN